MRRALGCATLALALLFVLGSGVWAQAADVGFSGGTGTAADPYLISSEQDLLEMAGGSGSGLFFALTDHIVLTAPWTPIPVFEGVLDGRGHAITGIIINTAVQQGSPWAGFIGRIAAGGQVSNLTLEGALLVTAENGAWVMAGGLAGQSAGHVENCHGRVAVTVTGAAGDVDAGGLLGVNDGSVYHSGATANIALDGQAVTATVGGLIGHNGGVVGNSYAAGDLLTSGADTYLVGGVIGGQSPLFDVAGLYWKSDAVHMVEDIVIYPENKQGIGNGQNEDGNRAKSAGIMMSQGFADELNGNMSDEALYTGTVWMWDAGVNGGYPYTSIIEKAEEEELPPEETEPPEEEPAPPLAPLDVSEIAYRIDEAQMVILSPTAEQLREIVNGAPGQTILLDLSPFIGAVGVGLELDMDWWFNGAGKKLTVMLTTGEAVEISDRMFEDPGLLMAEDKTVLLLKQGSLSVSFSQKGEDIAWYNTNEPLVVSLPYEIKEPQNPDRLVMVQDLGEEEPQHIIPRSWFEDGRVYAKAYSGGDFDVKYSRDVVYTDVAGKWMEDAVNYTTARGVIADKATGFAPNDTVTRVEFIRMFMRMLDIDISDAPAGRFNDEYAIPSWGIDSVNKALELGFITGDGHGNFNPLDEISRQDMMVIIYRALDYLGMTPAGEVAQAAFRDMSQVKGYAVEAINVLAEMDLVHGYNGNINPEEIATRAEVVQMFYNVLSWDSI